MIKYINNFEYCVIRWFDLYCNEHKEYNYLLNTSFEELYKFILNLENIDNSFNLRVFFQEIVEDYTIFNCLKYKSNNEIYAFYDEFLDILVTECLKHKYNIEEYKNRFSECGCKMLTIFNNKKYCRDKYKEYMDDIDELIINNDIDEDSLINYDETSNYIPYSIRIFRICFEYFVMCTLNWLVEENESENK